MKLHKLLPVLCVLTLIYMPAPSHAGATRWIPIKVENGAFLIETRIAGIDGYSIIDTGATINGINRRFIRANGLDLGPHRSINIKGVYGTARHPLYNEVNANLFSFDTKLKRVAELSLGPPDLQLILGAGFLSQFIVQFDYLNKRMRLLTRDTVDLKKISNVKSKMDNDLGGVIAKVSLNNEHDTWLIIDTGATGSTLFDRAIAAKRNWLDKFPRKVVQSFGVNSTGLVEQFRLPSLKIGEFEIADALVSIPAEGEKLEMFRREKRTGSNLTRTRGKSKGLLGYDVLKHFVLTIDYRIGKIHLEPAIPA